MVEISIIIPAYNAEKWIEKCVDSIDLNYCGNSVECIIVNDGSFDDTLKISKELSIRYKQITVFNIPNGGVSNARNQGIEIAKGKWVMFLDSDDELCKDWFSIVSNSIQENEDLIIYDYIVQNKKGKRTEHYSSYAHTIENLNRLLLTTSELNMCWGKLYKRSIINEHNVRFCGDIKIGEDFLFVLEYVSFVKSVKLVNSPIVVYMDNSFSVMHTEKIEERLNDNLILMEARLRYSHERRISSLEPWIYILHFRVLTNILLDVCRYYSDESKEIFLLIQNSKYTHIVLDCVRITDLSLLKKIEYLILLKAFNASRYYYKLKSLI